MQITIALGLPLYTTGLAAAACPALLMAGAQDPACPRADALGIAAALQARWMRLARFTDASPDTCAASPRRHVRGCAPSSASPPSLSAPRETP